MGVQKWTIGMSGTAHPGLARPISMPTPNHQITKSKIPSAKVAAGGGRARRLAVHWAVAGGFFEIYVSLSGEWMASALQNLS